MSNVLFTSNMKKFFTCIPVLFSLSALSQNFQSIDFHLYTDSLKKGTYNYISIDGKLDNGRWLPLTSKEIAFNSSAGVFKGNDLIVDKDEKADSIHITATLRQNSSMKKEITIWIKKKEDNEVLPTNAEYINQPRKRKKS